jgi:hypothetical protein
VLNTPDLNPTSFQIFPNPVHDLLNIYADAMVSINTVNIYNISGQLVKSQKNFNSINVSDLQQGIYLIEIETSNGREVKKFIKK